MANNGSIQGDVLADEDDIPQVANPDQRISRSKWPTDPAKRLKDLQVALKTALREYFGNVTVIAVRFNLPESEIRAAIDASPTLLEQEKDASRIADALLEDKLLNLALNGDSGADCRFLLERRMPEIYAKKSTKEAPKRNFELPTADPTSALDGNKPKP